MAVLIEGNRLGDIVKYESGDVKRYSREDVVVRAGQDIALGAVLGRITKSIPSTGTKAPGNTGDGETGANAGQVSGGPLAQIGTYTLTCIKEATAEPAAPAEFSVVAPDGTRLPDAVVDVAYENPQINFTLTAGGGTGAAPFALGDVITIPVIAGAGQVTEINFDAVDGSQDAYGILIDDVDTTGTLKSLAFSSGGPYVIRPGDLIVGATGGATARVVSVLLSGGTWAGGDATGTLILVDLSGGAFGSENLDVGDNKNVATAAADAVPYYPDRPGVAVVRDAVIDARHLVWPADATPERKEAAIAQLAERGIIVRTAA